jgi:hypothetical protein
MARWKITPTWKKSVIERQYWDKDDMSLMHEIGWRWGEFFIETEGDDPPDLGPGVDILDCGYQCDDWSTDDGCWEETDLDDMTDLQREVVELFLEENSVFDLEEDGWIMSECEMIIDCELSIERVEN